MENSLLVAVLAGLGGMIGWGGADFFAKKTTDAIGSIKSLVWAHFFGTSFFGLFVLSRVLSGGDGLILPSKMSEWLSVAFFGALQMIVYWLVYEGFGKGKLALLNPVFASYSGIVALISVAFLGAVLTGSLVAALIIIFAGLFLLNLDFDGLKKVKVAFQPGLKEVMMAAALAAVWTLLWDKFIGGKDPLTYSLLMYFFMTLAALAFARLKKEKITGIHPSMWKFLCAIGLGEAIAYAAISWGYSSTSQTAVVALVSGSFSLPTIVLAHLFLKERITRLQMIASLIIVLGIILLIIAK